MFRKLKIQRKVFATVTVFCVITIIIIVLAFCGYIYQKNTEQEKVNFVQVGEIIKGRIESLIENMNVISSQIVGNATVQQEISQAFHSKNREFNYFDRHIEERIRVRRECAALNISKNGVDQIYIYQAPHMFLDYTADSGDSKKIKEVLDSNEWKNMCQLSDGRAYRVLMPHENPWVDECQVVFSLIRPMTATYTTGEVVSTLEVTERYETLKKVCALPKDVSMKIFVFDIRSGSLVYPYGENSDRIKEQYGQYLKGGEEFFEAETDSGIKEIIYNSDIENCQWRIMLKETKSDYLQPVYRTVFFIGLLCMLFIVFVVVIIFFISERLTRPVVELRDALDLVDFNNMEIFIEDDSNNEIELLRESFQKLLLALKKSSNSLVQSRTAEIQAKLIALQSTINPHFLYNSIMAVGAAGQEDGSKSVEQMCLELAYLFRYASEVNETAHLTEEWENLKIYLGFMKRRYLEDLNYELQGPDDKRDILIPKMIFQPIVENCFTHGFRMSRPPYRIKVECKIERDKWFIRVSDNGKGFAVDDLEELERIRVSVDENIRKNVGEPFELRGKALMNVYARLRLTYGKATIFSLTNQEDGGAKIILGGYLQEGETDKHGKHEA